VGGIVCIVTAPVLGVIAEGFISYKNAKELLQKCAEVATIKYMEVCAQLASKCNCL